MIDWSDNMDYYSGAPEPTDYEYNGNNVGRSGNFFKNNSFLLLLGLAILIAVFIVIFILTSKNNKPNYEYEDDNSYLEKLTVYGGTIEPSFSSEVINYTIVADTDYITFECKAASDKAKVEGCDDSVEVQDKKFEYNIKVTAEDSNVTRYYFEIIKAEE